MTEEFESVIYFLLFFALIIGGSIVQITIADLNTTAWNFTGSNMAKSFVPYMGGFIALVGVVGFVLLGYKGAKS